MPRLLTSRWRKQLLKVSNLCITMPFNSMVWSESNFEPLILAIFLPFFSIHPWKLKHTKFVGECERNLQEVWKDNLLFGRTFARTSAVSEDIGKHAEVSGAGSVIVQQR